MTDEKKFITVSQLGNYIKKIFDSEEMLHNISIFGEISAYKLYHGDTAYFSIKDENATIDCVMFGANKLPFEPKVGESVIVKGSPNYYVKGGRLSFNVRSMIAYGKGALYLKFLQLKEKLEKEGLFDEKHKKIVPSNAINIGVATSLQGAVLQDIRNVSYRRNQAVNLFVYGCRVQGTGADETIIEAIKVLDEMNLDVIIVARGGGSSEDLDCFNSERLARAVFACKTPIVSAVGHETDFTIIDFVADKRAPTPSAGAELVVANVSAYREQVMKLINRMSIAINRLNYDYKTRLNQFMGKIHTNISHNIERKIQNLELRFQQFDHFENISLVNKTNKINLLAQALEKSNPLTIMRRGFAQLENEQNQVVQSIEQLQIGQNIKINLVDGYTTAKINEVNRRTKNEI